MFQDVRVLVVDDSSTMRKIIIRSLQAVGINEIAEAGNCDDAFKALETHEPNVILLDVHIPGDDSIQFIKEVMQQQPVTVVAVCTEAQRYEMKSKATDAGAAAFLVKPFTADTLRQKLEEVLTPNTSE